MVADQDRVALDHLWRELPDLQRPPMPVSHGEIEHLVEVAVVHGPLPSDTQQVPAHHLVQRGGIKGGLEKVHVPIVLPAHPEEPLKSGNGHVGEAVKVVKDDAKFLVEDSLVVLFETVLGWRQGRPQRIVDQVEPQPCSRHSVAPPVEDLQRTDAQRKRPVSALAVHVLLGVARERCDYLDAVPLKKFRQVLLAWLKDDGEIAPIHDMTLQAYAGLHEIIEVGVQLWGPTRDIHGGDLPPLEETEGGFNRLAPHHLLPSRPSLHMTVDAGLVAILAHVDLKHIDLTLAKAVSRLSDSSCEGLHGSPPLFTRSRQCRVELHFPSLDLCSEVEMGPGTIHNGGPRNCIPRYERCKGKQPGRLKTTGRRGVLYAGWVRVR